MVWIVLGLPALLGLLLAPTRRFSFLLLVLLLVVGLLRLLARRKAVVLTAVGALVLASIGTVAYWAWAHREEILAVTDHGLGENSQQPPEAVDPASSAPPSSEDGFDGSSDIEEDFLRYESPSATTREPYLHPGLEFTVVPPEGWQAETFWAGVRMVSGDASVYIVHKVGADASELLDEIQSDLARQTGASVVSAEVVIDSVRARGFAIEAQGVTSRVLVLPSDRGAYLLGAEVSSTEEPSRRAAIDEIFRTFHTSARFSKE
jgi:hypothetical protein